MGIIAPGRFRNGQPESRRLDVEYFVHGLYEQFAQLRHAPSRGGRKAVELLQLKESS